MILCYCANLKAIRYESTSLNRIVADKSHHVILALLSDRMLLDFEMALSTAVLIAVTIKSAYLSRSLVDISLIKSVEPSAALSVDSNSSLSVWSNLYLVLLIDEFLLVEHQLRLRWVGDRCQSHHLFKIGCHILLGLVI